MFSIEQLQGILLSIAKPEVHISRADNLQIGYRVRVRVNIRGSKDFLSAVNRSLLQQSVTTKYKDKEHKLSLIHI